MPPSRPTVTVTEMYRRPPEPWFWVALLVIPLLTTIGAWYVGPPGAAEAVASPSNTSSPVPSSSGAPVDVRASKDDAGVSAVVPDTAVRDRLLLSVHEGMPKHEVVDETAVDPGRRLTDIEGLPGFLRQAAATYPEFDLRLTDDEVIIRGAGGKPVGRLVEAAQKAFPGRSVRSEAPEAVAASPSASGGVRTASPSLSAAPAPSATAAPLSCDRIEEGISARLHQDPVNFELESSRIAPDSAVRLVEIGKTLATCRSTGIKVQGHADATGPQALNVDLARDRAEAVRQVLLAAGVDAKAVEAQGFGARRNIAPNDTASARAKNRRVVILVGNGAPA